MAVCIGRRSREMDRMLARHGVRTGAFVTAWNPLSRRFPEGWNRRRLMVLRAAARRLPMASGRGSSPCGRWFEEHLLVAADHRLVAVLARRFRQRAIVIVRLGQPARLLVLVSGEGQKMSSGAWLTVGLGSSGELGSGQRKRTE